MESKLEKLEKYLNTIQDIHVEKKENIYIHNGYPKRINCLEDKDIFLHCVYFNISPIKERVMELGQLNSLLRRLIPQDIEMTSKQGLDVVKELPENYLARDFIYKGKPGFDSTPLTEDSFTLPRAYFNEKIGEQILERDYTFSDKILQAKMKENFPNFKDNKLITIEKRDYIRIIRLMILPFRDFNPENGFHPAGHKASFEVL